MKTSAGSESLPPGILPDVIIDYDNYSITVFLSAADTSALYGSYLQYLYLMDKSTYKKKSIIYGPILVMEGFDTEYPATTYCTPEDVTSQLRLLFPDGSKLSFTEATNPARSTVIDYILQAETFIDRETKDAWKEYQVVEEYHDINLPLAGLPSRDVVVSLYNSNIREFDINKGDKIEFWSGRDWVNYIEDPQVRDSSWWMDYGIGQIHFNNFWPWFNTGKNRIRCTYRYGATEVPYDIKEACTKIVAIRLLESDFNKLYIMNSKPIMDWNAVVENWKNDLKSIFNNRRRKIFAVIQR